MTLSDEAIQKPNKRARAALKRLAAGQTRTASCEATNHSVPTDYSQDDAAVVVDHPDLLSQHSDNDDLPRLAEAWRVACGGGVVWHSTILSTLYQWFGADCRPTPIQAATLAASILGRRNIVGAAPTGSGKTLAYVLPILSYYLEQLDDEQADETTNVMGASTSSNHGAKPVAVAPLQALILTPTRELARQVHATVQAFHAHIGPSPTRARLLSACLTGGLAVAKQARQLQQGPAIVIATPGRLWELVRPLSMSGLAPVLGRVVSLLRSIAPHCHPLAFWLDVQSKISPLERFVTVALLGH
jgi:DEAD/DEAH box helicase